MSSVARILREPREAVGRRRREPNRGSGAGTRARRRRARSSAAGGGEMVVEHLADEERAPGALVAHAARRTRAPSPSARSDARPVTSSATSVSAQCAELDPRDCGRNRARRRGPRVAGGPSRRPRCGSWRARTARGCRSVCARGAGAVGSSPASPTGGPRARASPAGRAARRSSSVDRRPRTTRSGPPAPRRRNDRCGGPGRADRARRCRRRSPAASSSSAGVPSSLNAIANGWYGHRQVAVAVAGEHERAVGVRRARRDGRRSATCRSPAPHRRARWRASPR